MQILILLLVKKCNILQNINISKIYNKSNFNL